MKKSREIYPLIIRVIETISAIVKVAEDVHKNVNDFNNFRQKTQKDQ